MVKSHDFWMPRSVYDLNEMFLEIRAIQAIKQKAVDHLEDASYKSFEILVNCSKQFLYDAPRVNTLKILP